MCNATLNAPVPTSVAATSASSPVSSEGPAADSTNDGGGGTDQAQLEHSVMIFIGLDVDQLHHP